MSEIRNKNIKWWISIGSFVFLFTFIFVFAYAKMNFIVKGVKVLAEINRSSNEKIVEVRGNAKNAVFLSLNGREIFIEKDGNFKEDISTLPGYGVITLVAKDKFGNVSEKKFEVIGEKEIESLAMKTENKNVEENNLNYNKENDEEIINNKIIN